jgi:hypothetical protein
VRTTLTLDDDVMNLLEQEARQTGASFKQVVNRRIRLGFAAPVGQTRKPFKINARPLGLPPGLNYDNVAELIEAIEGAEHK